MRHEGALSPLETIRLGLQVCDALGYAHDRFGLVHRDIKPANCLLTKDGNLKVTDFGLARSFDAAEPPPGGDEATADSNNSLRTMRAGTRPFMAPEQFVGDDLDTRVDIYGLGVMLYQMLLLDLPYRGDEAKEHILANPEFPQTANGIGGRHAGVR